MSMEMSLTISEYLQRGRINGFLRCGFCVVCSKIFQLVAIHVAGGSDCTIPTMPWWALPSKNKSGPFSGFERFVIVVLYSLMGRGDGGNQSRQHSRSVSCQVKVRIGTSSEFRLGCVSSVEQHVLIRRKT